MGLNFRIPDHRDITRVCFSNALTQHRLDVFTGNFKVQGSRLAIEIKTGLKKLRATAIQAQWPALDRLARCIGQAIGQGHTGIERYQVNRPGVTQRAGITGWILAFKLHFES